MGIDDEIIELEDLYCYEVCCEEVYTPRLKSYIQGLLCREGLAVPVESTHNIQVTVLDSKGNELWRSPLHREKCLPIKLFKAAQPKATDSTGGK